MFHTEKTLFNQYSQVNHNQRVVKTQRTIYHQRIVNSKQYWTNDNPRQTIVKQKWTIARKKWTMVNKKSTV